jgi:maleate isomerase
MDKVLNKTRIESLDFTTDAGPGERARIGLLVLESDQTMEWEFRDLTDLAGVAVYHSRLANAVTVTPETLGKMKDELPIAAKLLPDYLELDSIGYGCTSGSTIIGEDKVAAIFSGIHPGVPSTNPMTAAKAAFAALGVTRIGLLTPYSPDVTQAMQANFEAAGIAVSVVGSFYEESDYVVGKIDPESIRSSAIEIGKASDVDAVFISCTSLRAAGIIQQTEEILNKPVTASNHALAWHLLRLAGIEDTRDDVGELFRRQLTT